MAINNMSVGKDYSFVLVDGDTGTVVDLGDVQNVRITANKTSVKSMPYNDVPRYGYIPDGYAITFTITRTGPELEEFQLAANARFNAGQNTRAGYLNETVRNADGTVARYQYTGLVFWVGDLGEVARDTTVKVQVECMASDKVRIA